MMDVIPALLLAILIIRSDRRIPLVRFLNGGLHLSTVMVVKGNTYLRKATYSTGRQIHKQNNHQGVLAIIVVADGKTL